MSSILIIWVMLFSSAASGQDTRGMAIVANKEKALAIITVGPITVAPGHVAFAYQNPLTGLFVFGSVGMDLSKPTNLIDPKDLDINIEYTFNELKTLLANKGYTSYKAFYTDNPNFNAATKAEIDLTTANYNLFASTTKPITDPFSHAVGADDENCLTGTKKVLKAYGVDLPDWDESLSDTVSVASLPNVWYLSLQGNTYYPDFMGDDPIVPAGYGKSTNRMVGERIFTVAATADWIDTGIHVSEGDSIKFAADGQATYGREGSTGGYPTTNPDGDRFENDKNIGKKIDPSAIDPLEPIGSLVGKIGLNNDCFFIGSSNQLIMPTSGTIQLRYNDVEGWYGDNGGSYEVIISRSRSKNSIVGSPTAIRLFSNKPKTDSSVLKPNTYSEVIIDTNRYDKTPYHITSPYYGTITLQPGQRCFLAGDAEGKTGWNIDNFLLFEIQTKIETKRCVCGVVDPVYYNGERVAQLGGTKFSFEPKEIDLTQFFPTGTLAKFKVSALDYGDFGYVSDVYLIVQ